MVFKILSKFVQIVHTNFHANSGLSSSRNQRVMINFAIWQPFFFPKIFQNLFRLSILTSMQNLESVAQKMSELCHLVRKRTDTILSILSSILYSQAIIQSKLEVCEFASLDNIIYFLNCKIIHRNEFIICPSLHD